MKIELAQVELERKWFKELEFYNLPTPPVFGDGSVVEHWTKVRRRNLSKLASVRRVVYGEGRQQDFLTMRAWVEKKREQARGRLSWFARRDYGVPTELFAKWANIVIGMDDVISMLNRKIGETDDRD